MAIDDKNTEFREDKKWLESKSAYYTYCAHAAELHDKLDLPTYEEWVESINSDSPHETFGLRASFVNNPNFAGFASVAAGMVAGRMGIDTSSAESAIASGSKILQREFSKRANGGGKFTVGGGGDGGTTKSDYSGGSPFNPHGLSLNARPIDSSWRTGIKVNYDPKYFLDGRDDTSPLILKAFTPLLGDSSNKIDIRLDDYFSSKIMSEWITYFQLDGRWNLYTQGAFTETKFKEYFNIISQALSLFYFYASLSAHYTLEVNRNQGMIDLYDQLDPTELNQLFILKNTLNTIPVPPELNEMCFKLFNNYKQSYNPGSPLIKFCPIDASAASDNFITFGTSTKVVDVIDKMKSDDFRAVQAVIAQAKPEWATNVKLYAYTGLPNFDADFLTLFVNSEYLCNSSAGLTSVPSIGVSTDEWIYNIHTDAPDGWTQALSNVNVGANSSTPGFGGPKTLLAGSVTVNDLIWAYDSGVQMLGTSCVIYTRDNNNAGVEVAGFWPISKRTRYQALSGNTYTILDSNPTAIGYQKFGTTRVLPVTGNTNYIPAQQLMDIVMSPNQSASGLASSPIDDDTTTERKPRKRGKRRKVDKSKKTDK